MSVRSALVLASLACAVLESTVVVISPACVGLRSDPDGPDAGAHADAASIQSSMKRRRLGAPSNAKLDPHVGRAGRGRGRGRGRVRGRGRGKGRGRSSTSTSTPLAFDCSSRVVSVASISELATPTQLLQLGLGPITAYQLLGLGSQACQMMRMVLEKTAGEKAGSPSAVEMEPAAGGRASTPVSLDGSAIRICSHLVRWTLWQAQSWLQPMESSLAVPWRRGLDDGSLRTLRRRATRCKESAKQLHQALCDLSGVRPRMSLPEVCMLQRVLRILETDVGKWLPASPEVDMDSTVAGPGSGGRHGSSNSESRNERSGDAGSRIVGRQLAMARVARAMEDEASESIPSQSEDDDDTDQEDEDDEDKDGQDNGSYRGGDGSDDDGSMSESGSDSGSDGVASGSVRK